MWAKDYEGALEYYIKILQLEESLDALSLYRIHFDLAIVCAILKKHELKRIPKLNLELNKNLEETKYLGIECMHKKDSYFSYKVLI